MKNLFICSGCGTNYYADGTTPPPTPRWSDGHVCTPKLVKTTEDGLQKN